MSINQPRSLLRLDGVTVRFGGVTALDKVSFTVPEGSIFSLIGPNGAGKSTLFNCLSRLYKWSEGQIHFNEQNLALVPRHRIAHLGIGRTFQNLALFPTMTVLENVLIGTHSRHDLGILRNTFSWFAPQRHEQRALALVEPFIHLLDLEPVLNQVVADLPFGTQKRVELARALATEPKLLLLDEPACGLNYEELMHLGGVIQRIKTELGITVLLVEHNMSLVMSISEQIVVLNFGKKIAEGVPAEVQNHPAVIEAYLGKTNEELA